MKKIAKITGVLLAAIMVLATLGIFASAANENKLTIQISGGVAMVTDCSSTASGTVDIPSTYGGVSVTRIYDKAFMDCAYITQVNVPSSVTRVGSNAFANCVNLKKVVFDGTQMTFGTGVFNECSVLESVNIPSGLTSIPSKTFRNCVKLTDATIPSDVYSIESEAFANCRSLTSVTIPAATEYIESSAFLGCSGVSQFTVESGNSYYSSKNGVLYGAYDGDSSTKALLQYPIKKTASSYTVESGTKVIAEMAFGDNAYITSVALPSGLEKLDDYAFYNCEKLSNITIPSGVTKLGSQSFGRCTSLKSITIPSSVTSIESAFYMSGLESVVIKNGLTVIGTKAFEDCASLTSVTIPSSVKTIGTGAFSGCTALSELYIPSTVTAVRNGAFTDCDVTLTVDEGSAAHTYAIDNSIDYKIYVAPVKQIKSVTVAELPDKTSYNYKDTLDTNGLVLSVNYTDGTSEKVTSGYEVSPEKLTKTGSQVITVDYEGYTASFSVNVSYSLVQWIIMIFLLGFLWY